MAQTEVAFTAMPHGSLPINSVISPTDGVVNESSPLISETSVEAPIPNVEHSGQIPLAPGTLRNTAAPAVEQSKKSKFSVMPDYLPSWVTNQPLAYMQYGATPAVMTIHFGAK